MMCERCQGKGTLVLSASLTGHKRHDAGFGLQCNDCGGTGVIHCCEGDSVQPGERREVYEDDGQPE